MELKAVRMRLRNEVLKSVTQHRFAAIVLKTRSFRRFMRLNSFLHYLTAISQVHRLLALECLYYWWWIWKGFECCLYVNSPSISPYLVRSQLRILGRLTIWEGFKWKVVIMYSRFYTCIYREVLRTNKNKANKLRGLSPRANYTDRATAACRWS
jgi:hypothetical protein